MDINAIKKRYITTAPSTVGVYVFFNKKTPVYIGKSINIKARLKSHFENAKIDPKEFAIFENTTRITYIPTENEFLSLLLEASLIKKHLPKYNVIWRDGKSHLYIKITTGEMYPKISLCRKEDDGASTYFGPFAGVRIAEGLLREIRSVVPYCTQAKLGRPCFYSKIGLCNPCPSAIEHSFDAALKKTLHRQYRKNINTIISILRGKTITVLRGLEAEMKRFSRAGQFEAALAVRNRIFHFQKLISERVGFESPHSMGMYRADPTAGARLLHSYLIQFFKDLPTLERIECLDISNTSQREIVGGLVVATDGALDKSQYRKFKIKNSQVQSDFDAIEEVLRRRFAKTDWPIPQLFLIDGGAPQVRRVLAVCADMGVTTPVVGIAKNPDRLVMGIPGMPTKRLETNNPAFNIVRLLRDEAHRFSKKYHTALRTRHAGG